MDLIDVDRLGSQRISAVLHELIVIPDIIIRIVYDRSVVRSCLEMSCERIALLIYTVIRADNPVFITVPLLCIRNLLLPDAGLSQHKHPAVIGIPVIEITHDADHSCIRSPDAEDKSLAVLILIRVSAEELITHIVLAFVE